MILEITPCTSFNHLNNKLQKKKIDNNNNNNNNIIIIINRSDVFSGQKNIKGCHEEEEAFNMPHTIHF